MTFFDIIIRVLKLGDYYATRNQKLSVIRHVEKRLVKKWLDVSSGEKILELACGLSGWSRIVTKRGGIYYGIDIDYKNVMKTKKRFEVSRVINMDAEHPCFKAEMFEKVFCNSSLQQFENDEKVLENLNRCLKSSGLLIMTMDSLSRKGLSRKYRDKHRKRYKVFNYYDDKTITSKLARSNFEIIDYKYYFNSFISDYFFFLGIVYGFHSWIQYLFPLSFPLILVGDYFFGNKKSGCGLAVKAVKKGL